MYIGTCSLLDFGHLFHCSVAPFLHSLLLHFLLRPQPQHHDTIYYSQTSSHTSLGTMSGSIRSLWSRSSWPSRSLSPSKSDQSSRSSQFSQQAKKSIEEYGQRMKAKMSQARWRIKKAASKAKNMWNHVLGREKTLRKRYVSPFSEQSGWMLTFSQNGEVYQTIWKQVTVDRFTISLGDLSFITGHLRDQMMFWRGWNG